MAEFSKKELKLPVWLKLFARREDKVEKIDELALRKMAQAFSEKKSVIVLHHGQPVRISLKSLNEEDISITEVDDFSYAFE